MTWGIVVGFVIGLCCGMVAIAIFTMSQRQDDWKDSL